MEAKLAPLAEVGTTGWLGVVRTAMTGLPNRDLFIDRVGQTVQGFYYSRPVSAADSEVMMRRGVVVHV